MGNAGSVEEWVGWMGACRVGCRKALGYDAKRRRYWAFGAGLGAWRVYVEEQEGALWGWYEGMHCMIGNCHVKEPTLLSWAGMTVCVLYFISLSE